MKKCPRCEAELKPTRTGGIEIDECGECKGIWFDKDELRRAEDGTDPDLGWLDSDIWSREEEFRREASELICPACSVPLHAIAYGATGIKVDYCAQCHGTWLDRGEFKKIIAALTDELLTKSFSDYVKTTLREASEIVTGHESLVSEWKDFLTVLRMMQYRFFVERPGLLNAVLGIQQANPFK